LKCFFISINSLKLVDDLSEELGSWGAILSLGSIPARTLHHSTQRLHTCAPEVKKDYGNGARAGIAILVRGLHLTTPIPLTNRLLASMTFVDHKFLNDLDNLKSFGISGSFFPDLKVSECHKISVPPKNKYRKRRAENTGHDQNGTERI